MTKWQKLARAAVAVIGIAAAVAVFLTVRQRETVRKPDEVKRTDPDAISESRDGVLEQVRGAQKDYEIKFEKNLIYANGRTRLFGVNIIVRGKEGRDFQVSAGTAEAGENQRILQLTENVKLTASDGFELTTPYATFNEDDGLVRAMSDVAFARGRMHGSGSDVTYDKNRDVLGIAQQAHVTMSDEAGNVTMDFTSMSASLDRLADVLTLDGTVHVLRDAQVLDADHAVAHMSEKDEFITLIQLRGNARVEGGAGSLDAMSAQSIDLQYTPDGQLLDRVALTGNAAVALTAEQEGGSGRQFIGSSLELRLAADESVSQVHGKDGVEVRLPAAADAPSRRITAKTLEGGGASGEGLTSLMFSDAVEFTEEGARSKRIARSTTLQVSLAMDAVTSAIFLGGASFEDQGLNAGGARADYKPAEGTLQLSGRNAGKDPFVEDEQVRIEGRTIDVTLEGHKMSARDSVRTTLRPKTRAPGRGSAANDNRRPRLLQDDMAANVTSDRLEYLGADGTATFAGSASLWQGETALRAETIVLDQAKGDLVATGGARSTLALDSGGTSVGRANEIRYIDARRVLAYSTSLQPPAPAGKPSTPPAARGPVPPAAERPATPTGRGAALPRDAQLSGPQGELHADRIEVVLADEGNNVQRIEGYTNVSLALDTRRATAGRLTYHADDERYEMTGTAAVPVSVLEGCREMTGKTLTFFKSADRIIVDGNEEIRTKTASRGPCPQAPAAAPAR